jgi:hypothetical protein
MLSTGWRAPVLGARCQLLQHPTRVHDASCSTCISALLTMVTQHLHVGSLCWMTRMGLGTCNRLRSTCCVEDFSRGCAVEAGLGP